MKVDEQSPSHDQAMEAARRLIAGAFRRDGETLSPDKRPRFSIPARPAEDDDLVLMAYLSADLSVSPSTDAGRTAGSEELARGIVDDHVVLSDRQLANLSKAIAAAALRAAQPRIPEPVDGMSQEPNAVMAGAVPDRVAQIIAYYRAKGDDRVRRGLVGIPQVGAFEHWVADEIERGEPFKAPVPVLPHPFDVGLGAYSVDD